MQYDNGSSSLDSAMVLNVAGTGIMRFLRPNEIARVGAVNSVLSKQVRIERARVAYQISRRIEAQRHQLASPVTIAYREDDWGGGAFWDHYTTQKMTGRDTVALHLAAVKPFIPTGAELEWTKHHYEDGLPRSVSSSLSSGGGEGLLMIAGSNIGLESEQPKRNPAHSPEDERARRHAARQLLERDALWDARHTGRPVLAVCGGSWRLLEAFGGRTRALEPETHQSRQGPYIRQHGSIAVTAKEHGVSFTPNTILSGALTGRDTALPGRVNSVHWAAADESRPGRLKDVEINPSMPKRTNKLLEVTARGITGEAMYANLDEKKLLRKYGLTEKQVKKRDPHSVEAFETRHGAPMLGVQWHPEAYNESQTEYAANRNLMNYMARAGDAFDARRAMVRQAQTMFDAADAKEVRIVPSFVKYAEAGILADFAPRPKSGDDMDEQ